MVARATLRWRLGRVVGLVLDAAVWSIVAARK
jgi:hypothetical protein